VRVAQALRAAAGPGALPRLPGPPPPGSSAAATGPARRSPAPPSAPGPSPARTRTGSTASATGCSSRSARTRNTSARSCTPSCSGPAPSSILRREDRPLAGLPPLGGAGAQGPDEAGAAADPPALRRRGRLGEQEGERPLGRPPDDRLGDPLLQLAGQAAPGPGRRPGLARRGDRGPGLVPGAFGPAGGERRRLLLDLHPAGRRRPALRAARAGRARAALAGGAARRGGNRAAPGRQPAPERGRQARPGRGPLRGGGAGQDRRRVRRHRLPRVPDLPARHPLLPGRGGRAALDALRLRGPRPPGLRRPVRRRPAAGRGRLRTALPTRSTSARRPPPASPRRWRGPASTSRSRPS
jgi:hypothetical protein